MHRPDPRRALIVAVLVVLSLPLVSSIVHASMIAQSSVVSDDPADYTPNVTTGRVFALAKIGPYIVVGGHFHEVAEPGKTAVGRANIVAFDADTGAILPSFAPVIDGNVLALATDGTSIYAGGVFTTTNGVPTSRLVKLDLQGRVVGGFSAAATGGGKTVTDLALANGRLFVSGSFSAIDGVPRSEFAALDLSTGAPVPGVNVAFTGLHNGGISRVEKIDVTPDGSTLIAIGNFTAAGGLPREQIAVLGITADSAVVEEWSTQRFVHQCAVKHETYTRDVSIAPDGTWFVLVTSGAYSGGLGTNVLCDSASRWELSPAGGGQQPTWVDYSGGDSNYTVAVTGVAIYVGGHERWWNSPYAGDMEGPGSIRRTGIAALDPVNGMPLEWDPTRQRGAGVFAFLTTNKGLWAGSDTETFGHEHHERLAFFPLAGGTTPPVDKPSTLPSTLYTLPAPGCPSVDPAILYRVNAGGARVASVDCGPDWASDITSNPLRTDGSVRERWGPIKKVTPGLPDSTPLQVFEALRTDPVPAPEMRWNFPVHAGTSVRVRLFFANRCWCSAQPGTRTFSVAIEGTTVLDGYDVAADVGHNTAVMKAFDATSDGVLSVAFRHVTGDPIVSALEIVRSGSTPVREPAALFIRRRAFDGHAAGAPSRIETPSVDWSRARGAFMVGGVVYAAWADGTMDRHTFNGTNLSRPDPVYLHALNGYFPVRSITGMAYRHGHLYYTLKNQDVLYMRYFSRDAEAVGAQTFVISRPGSGFSWGSIRGMTLADGKLYLARVDGTLSSITWAGGPVPGTLAVIDRAPGQHWASHGMFTLQV